jgi:hypothetical protein
MLRVVAVVAASRRCDRRAQNAEGIAARRDVMKALGKAWKGRRTVADATSSVSSPNGERITECWCLSEVAQLAFRYCRLRPLRSVWVLACSGPDGPMRAAINHG